MEQNIAAANDGQVAAPETTDNTEVDIAPQEAGGAGEEATQAFSQDEVQKQEADGNATRAFSQRLKKEKEKYDKEYEPYKELFEELRALGVEAESPREALLFLRAESEAYAQRQSHAEKVSAEEMFYAALEAEPAYLAAKEMAYEKMYADDLAAIKEVFPDVTASHVSQLGQVYLSLMRAGLGDVVAAYAAACGICGQNPSAKHGPNRPRH